MTTPEHLLRATPRPGSPAVRDVLGAAWALFQVSLPRCLPLSIVAVAASAVPTAQLRIRGESPDYWHGPEWWGVYVASTVLALICCATVMQVQLQWAQDAPPRVFDSLTQSSRKLPQLVLLLLPSWMAFALAMVCIREPGLAGVAALLLLTSALAGVMAFLAWPLQIHADLAAGVVVRRTLALLRNRWRTLAVIMAALLAVVVIFTLLTGIFMAVLLYLAGLGEPATHAGLSASRWLMAAVLALPFAYLCAASVAVYHAFAPAP